MPVFFHVDPTAFANSSRFERYQFARARSTPSNLPNCRALTLASTACRVRQHLLPTALELTALCREGLANDIAPVKHMRTIESFVVCVIENNDEVTFRAAHRSQLRCHAQGKSAIPIGMHD